MFDFSSVIEKFGPFIAPIDSKILESLECDAPKITEVARYLHLLGGKRIRPLLCSMAAHTVGMKQPSPQLIDAAAGIEMIHMATLLHDDIIDNSDTRRGKPSALRAFGVPASILAGDFLLVQAFGLCARLDQYVIEETRKACIELTEGESLETPLNDGMPYPYDLYLTVARKKTASLFKLSAVVGGYLGGGEHSAVSALGAFGEAAGVAFQIADDILDITADENLLGKPSGLDLKQASPSLPNVLWLEREPERAGAFFQKQIRTDEEVLEVKEHLVQNGIIQECRSRAEQFVGEAAAALAKVESHGGDEEMVEQLEQILRFVVERAM